MAPAVGVAAAAVELPVAEATLVETALPRWLVALPMAAVAELTPAPMAAVAELTAADAELPAPLAAPAATAAQILVEMSRVAVRSATSVQLVATHWVPAAVSSSAFLHWQRTSWALQPIDSAAFAIHWTAHLGIWATSWSTLWAVAAAMKKERARVLNCMLAVVVFVCVVKKDRRWRECVYVVLVLWRNR